MKKISIPVMMSFLLLGCGQSDQNPVPEAEPPSLIGTWEYKLIDDTDKVLEQGTAVIVDKSVEEGQLIFSGGYRSTVSDKEGVFGFDLKKGEYSVVFIDGIAETSKSYMTALDKDSRFDGSGVNLVFTGEGAILDDNEEPTQLGQMTLTRTSLDAPKTNATSMIQFDTTTLLNRLR